jgi:hypothetical protein
MGCNSKDWDSGDDFYGHNLAFNNVMIVKVKVKSPLCLINSALRREGLWGVEV